MGGMSMFHWLIVIVIVLIVFGPSRLPSLGKSLGQAIRGFKKGLDEGTDGSEEESRRPTPPAERLVAPEASSPAHHESRANESSQVTPGDHKNNKE